MRKFLKNILHFSIGLVLLNSLFYFFIFKPAIFDKYIFNKKSMGEYNLFLVSDSHGGYIKDSPSKNHIFNFSNSSENYLDMFLKIQYLTSVLSKNDTILLAIDNHNLSSYRNGTGRINENIIYANDFSTIEKSDINSSFHLKKIMQFLPILQGKYNNSILQYLKSQFIAHKNITAFSKLSNNEKEIACKKRYEAQFENKIVSAQQKGYLEKIIQLCKEKNITLIGLKFPISIEYWKIIAKNDFGIKKMWISHNLEIIDLHDLFFDKDEFFRDLDHMNIKGGELFSKAVLENLKKLKKERPHNNVYKK